MRIIGGRWRGSKLPVARAAGLRPSSDRVRETLFNWLAPVIPGCTCVDLFAGSGALGFEAASRGAARAVLVEQHPALAASLRETAQRLQADNVDVVTAEALRWLAAASEPLFDLAFVDPPFDRKLWQPALQALLPRLAPTAWLYVESSPDVPLILPEGFLLHREGRTREVAYRLLRRVG